MKAVVINNKRTKGRIGHYYDIGQVVTILRINSDGESYCKDNADFHQWLTLSDLNILADESYLETYYEVSAFIERQAVDECGVAYDTICSQGRGGLYTLAKMWTDEFETLHADKQWDGEWDGTLDEFLSQKNNS
jgi:hypothetical protein